MFEKRAQGEYGLLPIFFLNRGFSPFKDMYFFREGMSKHAVCGHKYGERR